MPTMSLAAKPKPPGARQEGNKAAVFYLPGTSRTKHGRLLGRGEEKGAANQEATHLSYRHGRSGVSLHEIRSHPHSERPLLPRLACSRGLVATGVRAQCLGMMNFPDLAFVSSDRAAP